MNQSLLTTKTLTFGMLLITHLVLAILEDHNLPSNAAVTQQTLKIKMSPTQEVFSLNNYKSIALDVADKVAVVVPYHVP